MASWIRVLGAVFAVVLIGSLAVPLSTAPAGTSTTEKAQVRPNIVMVLTDDMRADELRFLPAVRRLQRSGVTFTRALSADSLCCPARATLLTGKLAHNHMTLGNNPATHGGFPVFVQHNDIQNLLPQWLDSRGYRTAWIGKYLNGIGGSRHFHQPDWTYFAIPVENVYDYWTSDFSINRRFHTKRGYREVYTRRLLLQRIRRWSPGRRPFFVVDSTLAPHRAHGPGIDAPGVQRMHRGFNVDRLFIRPSVGETNLSDKPVWLQDYAAGLPGPLHYPAFLERHRVEALQSVNDTVRRLVATLRRQHELDRTVVIFTSDNGLMLHEHELSRKNKPYEESVHVPLVVRGPGFRGGGSAHQTVSLADVTATIRRIGGVTRSHGADGVPLEQVRAHPTSFGRRPVEIEGSVSGYPHWTTMPTDRIGRFYEGAVWGPYSLVHWETGDWEFYNRKKDPWQMRNSYSTHPRPGSPQALLQAWFRHHVDCRGPACNDLITRP